MTAENTKTVEISEQEWFPIRVLAEKTSVGTSTLRAWERRYGLIKPERTPKGHRLYCQEDIKRVLKILDLLDDGHSLPAIAELLSVNTASSPAKRQDKTTLATIWETFIQSTLEAVSDFSSERIDAIYNEASSLYPIDMVTDQLIQPTLLALGDNWKEHPDQGVAEEHFYSSWLKNRLGARFHHAYTQARGARIVCACMPGSYHEIGLMLFSLSALARGYRVLYFGADLPFNQINHIAKRSAARGIVLSASTQTDERVNHELSALIPSLNTPVFIGGPSEYLDSELIEKSGGILLGPRVSVALKVLESHVPAYSSMAHT